MLQHFDPLFLSSWQCMYLYYLLNVCVNRNKNRALMRKLYQHQVARKYNNNNNHNNNNNNYVCIIILSYPY